MGIDALKAIAREVMPYFTPFLMKAGEEIAKGVGQDSWLAFKGIFKKKGEISLLEKGENQSLSKDELQEVETTLIQYLENDKEVLPTVIGFLDLSYADRTKLQRKLKTIEVLNNELEGLEEKLNKVGVLGKGDIEIKIDLQETTLQEANEEIIKLIKKGGY
jgi:hypothetical protein